MEDKQRRRSRSVDDEQEALRKQAEDRLQSLNPDALATQSPEQVKQLLYELQIHQIEVEMQQEELRYTQLELEKSETLYRHLYQYAPHGYFTLNAKGCITEANFAATMLVGIQRWVLEGWPLRIFIAKSHQQAFDQFFTDVCRTKVTQRCELQLQGLDEHQAGHLRTVLLEGIVLTQSSSERNVYLITAVDITDRKKAEQELQRVNLRLEEQVTKQTNELRVSRTENEGQRMRLERYLIEAPTAICVLNGPDLRLDLVNPAFQRMFPHRQLRA